MSRVRPSARTWLARMADGACSARELVVETLARVDAADAHVHAVVHRDDDAVLAAADRADAARRAGDRRPLLGLPVSIKDVLDVAGWPTTAGSLARPGHVAQADATVVRRLREAGAIPLLKTNVPELSSSFETDNVIHGRSANPHDPERTPGGSSGGEGALLGADATIVGIGTDGGGSIRVPSHYCGTVGLRPTTGRTPETGIWPPTRAAGTMDFTCVGPMARHVDDLALLLPVISGADGVDPYAVDVPLAAPVLPSRPLRIGWYDEHPDAPAVTPGTREAVRRAVEALADAGHRIEPIVPPRPDAGRSATELFFAAAGADGGAGMREAVRDAGGRHHPQFAALLAGAAAGTPATVAEYLAVQAEVFAFRSRVRRLMTEFDAVLSPVVSGPAPRHGEAPAGVPADRYLRYEAFEFCHVNAVAGVPAASIPAGAEDGLPVGVQVAGPAFGEGRVLAVAALLEALLGGPSGTAWEGPRARQ